MFIWHYDMSVSSDVLEYIQATLRQDYLVQENSDNYEMVH